MPNSTDSSVYRTGVINNYDTLSNVILRFQGYIVSLTLDTAISKPRYQSTMILWQPNTIDTCNQVNKVSGYAIPKVSFNQGIVVRRVLLPRQ